MATKKAVPAGPQDVNVKAQDGIQTAKPAKAKPSQKAPAKKASAVKSPAKKFAKSSDKDVVADSYAIIKTGGKQYQAVPGLTLAVEKLEGEAGSSITFDEVLFVKHGEGKYDVGAPTVNGFKVKATIVKQDRGPKIVIFKMRRRTKYRVKTGHRQPQTIVRFDSF